MHGHKNRHQKDKTRGHFVPSGAPQTTFEVEPRPAGGGLAIGFFGASGTVTGSRYLLEDDSTRLLVDSGLFQGGRDLRNLNWCSAAIWMRTRDNEDENPVYWDRCRA